MLVRGVQQYYTSFSLDQYDDYDDDGSIIDGDGASEMMMDDGVSVHHKVLKSWETDYIRGYKATRGPILYVMENFPDKLNFQGLYVLQLATFK